MELELTIITPERRLNLRGLRQVMFQTPQGEAGLLPGHAALVTLAECGILRAFPAGQHSDKPPTCFVIGSGVLRAIDDRMTILVQDLQTEAEIDAGTAQQELDHALSTLATLDPAFDAEDFIRWRRTEDFNVAALALAEEMAGRQAFTHVD